MLEIEFRELESIEFNGNEVIKVILNNETVWEKVTSTNLNSD